METDIISLTLWSMLI